MSSHMKYIKRIVAMGVAFVMALSLLIDGWQYKSVSADNIGVISNGDTLSSAGVLIDRYPATNNSKAVRFRIDGEYVTPETGKGIFSVKVDGGSEYFYSGKSISSSTTDPGVYYSDGSSGSLEAGWYFVYPDGNRSKNIQVQVHKIR